MKVWIAIAILVASIATAWAISPAQQIILFGGNSSGSGGSGIPACGNGTINLSTGCTQPMLGGL
jgi:hypothetical protein